MRRAVRSTAAAGGTALVQVSLACLSADGCALASVESRSEAELRQHAALKLWAFVNGEWLLTARVPQPHQGTVCGLAFHPHIYLVASAATDAKFKLWEGLPPRPTATLPTLQAQPSSTEQQATQDSEPAVINDNAAAGVRWACRSVGYYRQSAATAVAFSADGTLLAVSYAPDVVTLWDPLTNELLHTLCQPLASPHDSLIYVGFAGEVALSGLGLGRRRRRRRGLGLGRGRGRGLGARARARARAKLCERGGRCCPPSNQQVVLLRSAH